MAKKVKNTISFEKYLVVKCVELDDQWECDADRKPICIIDKNEYSTYSKIGFEIYGILPNGNLRLVKEYDSKR